MHPHTVLPPPIPFAAPPPPPPNDEPAPVELLAQARFGVQLCRQGRWRRGYAVLEEVAGAAGEGVRLPSLFYAWRGYLLAWRAGRWEEGLEGCHRALRQEVFEAENHVCLARLYLLRDERELAVDCLKRALQLSPGYPPALALWARMGRRRRPLLGWLPREHVLNRVLGRLRHWLLTAGSGAARGG